MKCFYILKYILCDFINFKTIIYIIIHIVYWNNKNNAGMELWAEFYSYNMARDTENLAYLKEYFPESAKVLEGYAHALAD